LTHTSRRKKSYSLVFIGLGVFIALGFVFNAHEMEAAEASPPVVEVTIPEITEQNVEMLDAEGLRCLAENIYFEAGNQHTAGMVAVANVTLNRVQSKSFPNDICGVVKQGPTRPSWKEGAPPVPIRDKCQFSWYCDGKSDEVFDGTTWDKTQFVALSVYLAYLDKKMLDITDGALYYHADYVRPRWAKHMERTSKIGEHIFYR